MFFKYWLYYMDVEHNEKEVLDYLHSLDIQERGEILSPAKELWFKNGHYIRFMLVFVPSPNRKKAYHYAYTYCDNKRKYEGKPLELITLDQLKELINAKSIA